MTTVQPHNAIAIWWIRRDLRLTDNPALQAALAHTSQVIPLFILDSRLLNSSYGSPKRTAFLLAGLRALDDALRQRNSRLIVRQGKPLVELARLCREVSGAHIFAQRDFSQYARQRDSAVAAKLPITFTEGVAIRPVDAVCKDDGAPYTVYTPYSRKWKAITHLSRADILPAPVELATPPHIASLDIPAPPETLPDFAAGEGEGKQRLARFVAGDAPPIFAYASQRDRPDLNATAQLSPYLRFGMISARLAAVGAVEAMQRAPSADARKSAQTWLDELIWRDFYLAILATFPKVQGASFRNGYDQIAWLNSEDDFAAWRAGRTGYPFVDAAMRQLAATGWMHNRARMVTASFRVKHLLIDWRWGERWFMQNLVDGDPAANNGGWQWSAGTGTDAAPYFRIFNPITQGQKFDPDGDYIRRWVKELGQVSSKYIHEPWKMDRTEQAKAECRIGIDYPAPIVEHKMARQRALDAYKSALDGSG
ncbi:MAG: deoxyribodipyrimidine photo-lyase [Caldilineaceae bacterium]